MAEDIANYLMLIKKEHIEYLGQVMHWANIKMGTDEANIWVKDITASQVNAMEIKSIPYKTIYQNRDGQLFLPGNNVPTRNMPQLLWTQLERALPVTLPQENHNYFGLHQQVNIELSLSLAEQRSFALITTTSSLQNYIESAPAIRLKNLSWVIINKEHCLITGTPLLPLPGDTYWQLGNFLIPAGNELRLFYDYVNEKINPANDHWVVWYKDNTYFKIKKDQLKPLSLSSFRMSVTTG